MASSYYDVDAILAEEELVPCTTLFDFSYLSYLDPDNAENESHTLKEGSRIKVPLWIVEKWAVLGYVNLSLPRHYARKARDRLEADPSEVDLRKRNDRFFMAGRELIDLMETTYRKMGKVIASQTSGRNPKQNSSLAALEQVMKEARELQKTLVSTYTGQRLQSTLNWALSSVGDDVTIYTNRLTEMERRLFRAGASAATQHQLWKLYGNRRLIPRHTTIQRHKGRPLSRRQEQGRQQLTDRIEKRRRIA